MLDEIKAANASGVDEVYTRHQRTAHQKALALHQNYAANGDDQALKKVASEIVPVVQKHMAELGTMGSANAN
jgi:putative membrane protein